ncbi:MAG: class I SAM-dependent methyltransferase [Reyranella sp.]|uniref:class I SAM-dependent methyltransferase n=1 Tax=Reyranella sp. TaxID=1929291 RepID=UPI0012021356|nr:class I SAM-dependent methyltransferase [Reyranella sp.]TAJ85261.1 MAG: class I SAM-dependent methyltransferase [Reyranella sp.]
MIPQSPWARRLVYEMVYAWPGSRQATTFNVGLAPVDAEILTDPALAGDAFQLQLYAELFSLAGLDAEAWRRSAVIEVAAGCGGGLLYLSRRYRPRSAIGVDASAVAAWRGRRLGIDLRQSDATRLPFEDRRFDCLVCVDALNYFPEAEFMSEAIRVLKLSGRLLLADSSPTFADARARFQRLARLGGLAVDTLRDVSEGARRSLRERSPRAARAVAWVPPFLRRRVREMLSVEGSERYRRWQTGEHCFAMAVLSRQAVES